MPSLCLVLALLFPQAQADGQGRQVLAVNTHNLTNLGMEVTEIRSLDSATGLVIREAYGPDGSPVDLDSLRMKEQRLKIAARGKISPELGEILAGADGADVLPVAFWLAVYDEPDFRGIIDAAVASGVHPEEARRMALAEGRPV